jgi:hypothetical protein
VKQTALFPSPAFDRESLPSDRGIACFGQVTLLLVTTILLTAVSGCGRGDQASFPVEPNTVDFDAAFETRHEALASPPWGPDSPIETGAVASESRGKTRLASFMARAERPVQWSFGGFEASTRDRSSSMRATRLVQTGETPAVASGLGGAGGADPNRPESRGLSVSDVGQVEVIPTPPARPEVKAEMVPTPQGTPGRTSTGFKPSQPVARVAADVEGLAGEQGDRKSSPLESGASSEKFPGKPDLIDPAAEIGLVGAQEGPEDYRQWAKPDVVLFVTGNQHGYIEPCGCTGLDKQKGGMARRFTFLKQLRDMGWDLIPIDAGNQIRGIRKQAAIKFQWSSNALEQMQYLAVGFGPGDMRLSAGELISVAYADSPKDAMYVSANIVLLDPELLPSHKLVRQGEWTIGLSAILDPEALEAPVEDEVVISPIKESAMNVLGEMNAAGANFRVLTFFGEEETAKQLMVDVPGYDLVIVSGGYGEPTYRPQTIEGSEAKIIVTGNKGMFAGLVALYQNQPMKYARVPLTHEFKDAPEMRKLMAEYQQQLEQLGLSGLGLSPSPHPSGEKFVGTKTCAKCHADAFDVWEGSAHAEATAHIVQPPEGRGDVPRHFDPECISCHVTGWNPQGYYPYESGYLSLEQSAHLTGNGCENCHGPGAGHSAAEEQGSGASEERKKSLRLAMQLPLDNAKEHCMKCHDLDNSPDFHEDDAFEDIYWPEVEH